MSDLSTQELFKTLIAVVTEPERGFLGVLCNKTNVPLGYIAAIDQTIAYRPKELHLFAIYTNEKCPSTTRELMFELKNWAQLAGFAKITSRSFKRSGAAVRFFQKVLKMRQTGFQFEVCP